MTDYNKIADTLERCDADDIDAAITLCRRMALGDLVERTVVAAVSCPKCGEPCSSNGCPAHTAPPVATDSDMLYATSQRAFNVLLDRFEALQSKYEDLKRELQDFEADHHVEDRLAELQAKHERVLAWATERKYK